MAMYLLSGLSEKIVRGKDLSKKEQMQLLNTAYEYNENSEELFILTQDLIVTLYEVGIHNILGDSIESRNVKLALHNVEHKLSCMEVDYGFVS